MTTADRARVILAKAYGCAPDELRHDEVKAAGATIEALSQGQQGEVVVTRDEDGEIVMVSRQDADGQVLSVIASTTHAGAKQQGREAVAYQQLFNAIGDAVSVPYEGATAISVIDFLRSLGADRIYTTPPAPADAVRTANHKLDQIIRWCDDPSKAAYSVHRGIAAIKHAAEKAKAALAAQGQEGGDGR